MWYVVKEGKIISEHQTKDLAIGSLGLYSVIKVEAGVYKYLIKRWDLVGSSCPTELYFFINSKKNLCKCK